MLYHPVIILYEGHVSISGVIFAVRNVTSPRKLRRVAGAVVVGFESRCRPAATHLIRGSPWIRHMRVLRGRASSSAADRAVTTSLLSEPIEPAVRVWFPHRHLAFGPRDVRADGYDDACAVAEDQGFEVYERDVGGRAVAYTGTTICFAHVDRLEDERTGLTERYDQVLGRIKDALATVGVDAEVGEPEAAFCPGTHSLSCRGKLVGLAQRARRNVALTAGLVVPRDRQELIEVLGPVYAALDIPFDPAAVGSVRRAGGTDDPEAVRQAVEDALVTGADADSTAVEYEDVEAH